MAEKGREASRGCTQQQSERCSSPYSGDQLAALTHQGFILARRGNYAGEANADEGANFAGSPDFRAPQILARWYAGNTGNIANLRRRQPPQRAHQRCNAGQGEWLTLRAPVLYPRTGRQYRLLARQGVAETAAMPYVCRNTHPLLRAAVSHGRRITRRGGDARTPKRFGGGARRNARLTDCLLSPVPDEMPILHR